MTERKEKNELNKKKDGHVNAHLSQSTVKFVQSCIEVDAYSPSESACNLMILLWFLTIFQVNYPVQDPDKECTTYDIP